MAKMSCYPLCGKKKKSGRMLGVFYILSTTSPTCKAGGQRGGVVTSPSFYRAQWGGSQGGAVSLPVKGFQADDNPPV